MSYGKKKTIPDFSENSEKHIAAKKIGREHFFSYLYNVEDKFKEKSVEDIKNILSLNAFPFAILMENFLGDFNIATMIRTANAFNAKQVFYIGDKKIDRRGTVGAHNYMDIQWLPTIEELIALKEKYTFIGVDNIVGSKPLQDYIWKPDSLMIFGSEGVGLTPSMKSLCDEMVYIEQFGSIRSLNVGVAGGIVMHDFVSKFRKLK